MPTLNAARQAIADIKNTHPGWANIPAFHTLDNYINGTDAALPSLPGNFSKVGLRNVYSAEQMRGYALDAIFKFALPKIAAHVNTSEPPRVPDDAIMCCIQLVENGKASEHGLNPALLSVFKKVLEIRLAGTLVP